MSESQEMDNLDKKLRGVIDDYGGDSSDCQSINDLVALLESDMQEFLSRLHKALKENGVLENQIRYLEEKLDEYSSPLDKK